MKLTLSIIKSLKILEFQKSEKDKISRNILIMIFSFQQIDFSLLLKYLQKYVQLFLEPILDVHKKIT